CQGYSNSLFTF
nr:immunoglobulin light chain junction region [Macaca mulatta]MOW34454.1 immunoglobulin light chain junction region [Macaca mulatta]MOW35491.1 immunoglobulin light chain junction region [Macaca mulatta]MOW35712.1 immunoglobulin light chain junction region [Macaca mulatta]MOW35758.1 immunoglobulin light chain junction region [Macaca mulatta]